MIVRRYALFVRLLLAAITLSISISSSCWAKKPTLMVQVGHSGLVDNIEFGPQDRSILSSADNVLILWDVHSGKELRTISKNCNAWTLVPKTDLIVLAEKDDTIKLVELTTGTELRTIAREPDGVSSLACSPNRQLIAIGTENRISIRDIATGKELGKPFQTTSWADAVFSPDSQLIAINDRYKNLTVWDLASREALVSLRHKSHVSCFAFSPDGRTIASSCSEFLELWEIPTGVKRVALIGQFGAIESIKFSPDGQTVAAGYSTGVTRIFDTSSGRQMRTLSMKSSVQVIAYSADGKIVACGYGSGETRLWNSISGKELQTLPGENSFVRRSVGISKDGKTIVISNRDGTTFLNTETGIERRLVRGFACGSSSDANVVMYALGTQGTFELRDAVSGKRLYNFDFFNDTRRVSFNPKKKLFARSMNDKITLYDSSSGEELLTLISHLKEVHHLEFSPDGSTIASGAGDSIEFWDVSSGKELICIDGFSFPIFFSPDGKTVISRSNDGTIKLWDSGSGKVLRSLSRCRNDEYAASCCFSADGTKIATGSEYGAIKLWSRTSGLAQGSVAVDYANMDTLAFSMDGNWLAFGTHLGPNRSASQASGDIHLCNARSGKELRIISGHEDLILSLGFNPDGKLIASGSQDATMKLWDVASGRNLGVFKGHSDDVNSVAFSPNGTAIVTGSADNTARVWNLKTRETVHTLIGHKHEVKQVCFSPNGKTVASADDETVKLWDASSGKLQFSYGASDPSIVFGPNNDIAVLARGGKVTMLNYRTHQIHQPSTRLPNSFSCIAFTSNSRLVALNLVGRIFEVWDVFEGKKLQKIAPCSGSVESALFSADGAIVAACVREKNIEVTDIITGQRLQSLALPESERLVSFSHNCKAFATVHDGGICGGDRIKIWDISSGEVLQECTGHSGSVSTAIFAEDDKTIVSDGADAIKRWDILSGKELASYARNPSVGVELIDLSPDYRTAVYEREKTAVKLRDESADKELGVFEVDGISTVYAMSADGKRVAIVYEDNVVKLWNPGTEYTEYALTGHSDEIKCLEFGPDGNILASGCSDNTTKLWDTRSGTLLNTVHSEGLVDRLCFSPDGKLLAISSWDDTLKLWSVVSGKEIATIELDHTRTTNPSFSPDSKTLAVAIGDTIKIWETTSGKELLRLTGRHGDPYDIAFSPDSRVIATGNSDYTITLWDINSGTEIRTLLDANSNGLLGFSPNGQTIINHATDKLKFWDLASGKLLCTLFAVGSSDWVVVDSDGRFDAKNPEDIPHLHWRFKDTTTDREVPLAIEAFMAQYYTPRLLARALNRESLPPVESIEKLNLVRPNVEIASIVQRNDQPDLVDVAVRYKNVEGIDTNSGTKKNSGVFNLRLFRDGQLVGYLPEQQTFSSIGRKNLVSEMGEGSEKIFTVRLPSNGLDEVTFTAYAFNESKVRSETASVTYRPKSSLVSTKGRAFVIVFGVDAYEDNHIRDLRCAVADALQYEMDLVEPLRKIGRYASVDFIPLVSKNGKQRREKVVHELPAIKSCLKGVIDALAGRSPTDALVSEFVKEHGIRKTSPDDLVLLAFSSHGETDESTGEFYILPSETRIDQNAFKESLDLYGISSAELADWLADVDAAEMVMIIDSCHSGAVAGKDFKPGPMDNSGLAQLAYCKQIRLLSASQADAVAKEYQNLGHGLLTYALLVEGIGKRMADKEPKNDSITLNEWLNFAATEVPQLDASSSAKGFRSIDARLAKATLARGAKEVSIVNYGRRMSAVRKLQQPSLLNFAKNRDFLIVGPRTDY